MPLLKKPLVIKTIYNDNNNRTCGLSFSVRFRKIDLKIEMFKIVAK
jgi:hypothetical protein